MMLKVNEQILIITDNDDSPIVKNLLKKRIFPLTRSSILSSLELIKHVEIKIIVLDKSHKTVDTIEFILNVRDVKSEILIFLPKEFTNYSEWSTLKKMENIRTYDGDSISFEEKYVVKRKF